MKIQTIMYRDHVIELSKDDDAESPRTWENLGIMVCKHKKYELGDSQIPDEYYAAKTGDVVYIESWKDVIEWIKVEYGDIAVILPLFLYDHSGITMYTDGEANQRQYDVWDSGQVGFIFVTKEQIKKECNVKRVSKKTREQVIKCLLSEIEMYDNYLTGSVYGYITDVDTNCYGFYGHEGRKEAIKMAENDIDQHIKEEQKKKEQKLKAYIKNNVPFEHRTFIN